MSNNRIDIEAIINIMLDDIINHFGFESIEAITFGWLCQGYFSTLDDIVKHYNDLLGCNETFDSIIDRV